LDLKNPALYTGSKLNLDETNTPQNLLYIIYTSGSTGEPKGVQITQNSILDFEKWLNSDFGLSKDSVFMNQAPFSFDLSVYELIGFLLFGGTILLNSRETIENHIE
jgi:D-alanine--poly(phosphoribitol) ligase subunit 1